MRRRHGVVITSLTQEAAVVHEWFSGYVNKQFTRLSMGRLLGDLSTRFDDSISGSHSPFKLGLYACHDTTVAGILNALKCFDDRWPFFTAYLSFELFRKQGSAKTSNTSGFAWLTSLVGQQGKSDDEVYIRVKYNSKDMHIPACAEQGQHLEGSGGTVCTCRSKFPNSDGGPSISLTFAFHRHHMDSSISIQVSNKECCDDE